MLDSVVSVLAATLTALISKAGYAGVAILMAIESACIPLPSEIIMPFAGSLVPTGRFSLLGAATAGAVGCNLGSTAAYWVGARGGRPAVQRWGRYLLLAPEDIDWSERFFARWGDAAVLVARMLPLVRTFIALPAGIAQMPMLRFQAYTFVGSWLWCLGLAYVGARLGAAWDSDPMLKILFHRFDIAIAAICLAAACYVAWHRFRSLRPRAGAR